MSDYWASLNPSTLQVCCGSERNNLRVFFSGILACCMDFCSRQFGSSWNFPSVVRFWTRSGNARSLYLKRIQYGAKFSKKKKDSEVLNFLARWWSSWVLKLRLATLNFFSLDIYASWSLDKCSDWLIDTQGFAYLLFSASSVGVAMAQLLQTGTVSILSSYDCSDAKAFCNQAKLAISLGFGAFFFLALSSCITGLRVARWWLS